MWILLQLHQETSKGCNEDTRKLLSPIAFTHQVPI